MGIWNAVGPQGQQTQIKPLLAAFLKQSCFFVPISVWQGYSAQTRLSRLLAKLARCDAGNPAKCSSKMSRIRIAGCKSDIDDLGIGFAQ